MIHSRKDYNRIQDPLGLIPLEEPVFLLRGQDALTINTLARYCELINHYEVDRKHELIESIFDHIRRIQKWQRSPDGRVKLPDLKSIVAIGEVEQKMRDVASVDSAQLLDANMKLQIKIVELTKDFDNATNDYLELQRTMVSKNEEIGILTETVGRLQKDNNDQHVAIEDALSSMDSMRAIIDELNKKS